MKRSNEKALRGEYRRLVTRYETELVFDVSDELKFTRAEAISIYKCGNWVAIKKLEHLLKDHKVKTVRRLFELGPQSMLRIDRIGPVTVYVAMCILDRHNYDVAEWWGWTKDEQVRHTKRHVQPADVTAVPVTA